MIIADEMPRRSALRCHTLAAQVVALASLGFFVLVSVDTPMHLGRARSMVRIDTGTTGASNRLIRGYQCAARDGKDNGRVRQDVEHRTNSVLWLASVLCSMVAPEAESLVLAFQCSNELVYRALTLRTR